MKIAILLWSPDISGGSYVIFKHASYLQNAGHEVSIITRDPVGPSDLAWFPEARKLSWATLEQAGGQSFDLAMATWWQTVFDLPRLHARQYAHFIQSLEDRFYPERLGGLRSVVQELYKLPLEQICITGWLEKRLSSLGQSPQVARNGIDKSIFTSTGPRIPKATPGSLRVLVEGPLGVAFKQVAQAIKLCNLAGLDDVWLLTSSDIDFYPGVDRVFSRIPLADTPLVYRSCDFLLKLSTVEGMFGPPLEMFHCGGTALTYAVTGHEEYMVHGYNSLVCGLGDKAGVLAGLRLLRDDRNLLARLRAAAQSTAAHWPDWERSSAGMARALENVMARGEENSFEAVSRIRQITGQYEQALTPSGPGGLLGRTRRAVQNSVKTRFPGVYRDVKNLIHRAEYYHA